MAEFVTVGSGVAEYDNSLVTLYNQTYILANQEQTMMDQFADARFAISGKATTFPKFTQLAAATTPLTETVDPDSVAVADAAITLTPAEYGNVVTNTRLANLQSGGMADTAAAQLVGANSAHTKNKLAIAALEAGTNELTVAASEAATVAGDIMTVTFLNKLYNKLARGNVPKFAGDMFVAVMHDDVIHDLRAATAAGSWQDVGKYDASLDVFKNEVGALAGFRIVRSNDVSVNADAGASAVDTYHSLCFGSNALGKAWSQEDSMTITPAGDKLGRFVNIGWYGVFKYGLIDTDNLWVGTSSSSVGANV